MAPAGIAEMDRHGAEAERAFATFITRGGVAHPQF